FRLTLVGTLSVFMTLFACTGVHYEHSFNGTRMTRIGRMCADLFISVCDCVYGKARRISTASGSERALHRDALATARGTDPRMHFSTPYIDLQYDLVLICDDPSHPRHRRSINRTPT